MSVVKRSKQTWLHAGRESGGEKTMPDTVDRRGEYATFRWRSEGLLWRWRARTQSRVQTSDLSGSADDAGTSSASSGGAQSRDPPAGARSASLLLAP